jgi:opacity protein-like surface antigen
MKLKDLVGLGMLAAPVIAAGAAHAQASPGGAPEKTNYISLSFGQISEADYDYNVTGFFPVEANVGSGYVIEGAYGHRFDDHWRGEIAVTWQDRDNANSSWQFGSNLTGPGMSAYTLDALGYYDFRLNNRANLYLGAGLGVGSITLDDGVVVDSTGSGLHIQGIAGVEAKLSGNMNVFADVRIKSLRPNVEGGTAGASGQVDDSFDITSTSVQAGFKILL